MKRVSRTIPLFLVLVCLLAAGAPTVSGQLPTSTAYTIALEQDGDATVTLTYAFDLDTAADAAAFDDLETDQPARESLATEFQTEMDAVAQRTATRTNRSMAVRNATTVFERTETSGQVRVRAEWTGLGCVEGMGERERERKRIVLSAPFSEQFTPDGTFRVIAPPGYAITSATPDPAQYDDNTATWDSNTTLTNFTVVSRPAVATEEADESTQDSSVQTPGFTGIATVVAIVCAVAVIRLRVD